MSHHFLYCWKHLACVWGFTCRWLLRKYQEVELLSVFCLFQNLFQAPNERARLYFLIAWFHAIIQERLRYAPLGWSKVYEFNESDLRMACDTLDTWLDNVAQVSWKK